MHRHPANPIHHYKVFLLVLVLFLFSQSGLSYSVQTHEQLIDLTWKQSIRPLLLQRFPNMTEAQLHEAHAYAYGGCAIQDLGYYPFGKPFFSDLTHYVRPGDFVLSLIHNAHSPDELAFAIGTLSHYIGDTIGHGQAVNEAVAIEFPKLAKKYGPVVTYDEGEHPHVRTEFAFDVNEISKRRFAPSAYLRHVGLEIPGPLLRRAFFQTYGLDLPKLIGRKRPVMRGYRFAVRNFLPRIAYAEVILHRKSFPADTPGPDFDKLSKDLAQSDFENDWDQYRKKAGIGTYMLAGVIYILPRIGPLSDAAIRVPTPHTQDLYVKSLNESTETLRHAIANFDAIATFVPNRDLDTGAAVRPGGYRLTDETYAQLLAVVTRNQSQPVPAGLKQNIANYYADPAAPICTKKNRQKWAQVQTELKLLATMPTTREPLPTPTVAEAN
ncbi:MULTISPECIES: zinc dependent phospholipase C family protein [Acidobacteriaceae]|uniref:zinc dependent phospholipase C family protein n=1 Tax=Acidobacteriaceae TaxID=204434 RepID=UPI00131BE344|nr:MULTISPECIES: zinc dependent phospholipase C family protein [Acidobacteriaceae]MDW5266889.1 zinc dependent phospholipase C family protein [Edaphobacter sp.]